ncbi:MAG: hypothetical protein NTW87_11225 [Planctomycetota bacterium]|nr:hypothetical protein [Planctomycetota bacterium]
MNGAMKNMSLVVCLAVAASLQMALAAQGTMTSEAALDDLKQCCSFKMPPPQIGSRPNATDVKKWTTKIIAATDYFVYVVAASDGSEKLLPYKDGMLKGEEVKKLSDLFSVCPENNIAVMAHAISYFGGGKSSDALISPTLEKALKQLAPNPLPPKVYFRFVCETRQVVVSFARDIKVDANQVTLHPLWKP